MKKDYQEVINQYLDVQPVVINSNLVSAQNRIRYYWSNWKISQPKDKNIFFQDIINDDRKVNVARMQASKQDFITKTSLIDNFQFVTVSENKKSNTLTLLPKDNLVVFDCNDKHYLGITPKNIERYENSSENIKLCLDNYNKLKTNSEKCRFLLPEEAEQLQTVPIGYTDEVSKSERLKMLGNGWTVDVITHIFKEMN